MNDIVNATADQFEQLVIFRLSDEYYGVDIAAVNTIIRMQEITQVPMTPDFVEGVINLRGSIVPVIDLRKRLHLNISELSKASRIVVVEAAGQLIGMVVDAVAETLRISTSAVEPPSTVISGVDTAYLRGVGKQDDRLIILLDLNRILSANENKLISQMKDGSEQAIKAA